jgi:hypothetical protein
VKGHVISEEGPQDVTPWERGVHESYEGSRVGDDVQGPLLPGTARKPSFERNGRWSDWT